MFISWLLIFDQVNNIFININIIKKFNGIIQKKIFAKSVYIIKTLVKALSINKKVN